MCTTCRRASTSLEVRNKPLDLDACPTPLHPPVGFVVQPINWGLFGFEGKTQKKHHDDFETQIFNI
jgi:hypothetical protein